MIEPMTMAACFLDKTCDVLEYDVTDEHLYPLGLESTVRHHARIRRVMTDAGEERSGEPG